MAARAAAGLCWDAGQLRYVRNGSCPEDAFMQRRLDMMKRRALDCRPLLTAARVYAPGRELARRAAETRRLFAEEFGAPRADTLVKESVLVATGALERLRIGLARLSGRQDLIRNPPTRRIEYRMNGSG
jgi:hypothetical protein